MSVKHLLLIAFLALTAACSSNEVVDENLSESQLYQQAQEDLDNKTYSSAIAKLKALESRYPFGRYAEQAKLMARQGVRYVPLEALDVMDPETMEVVPADGMAMGEVMFRGNVVMKGYLKDAKATEAAFAGGWFHSGDLAVKYPDGYIQLRDRSKDIIISGGENISSIEVEDALYKHPAVALAAVVAQPDDKWGEVPCAFVELRPGMSATEAEIVAHCRGMMAGFKAPKHVIFTELPKTSTGKIQKHVLRASIRG